MTRSTLESEEKSVTRLRAHSRMTNSLATTCTFSLSSGISDAADKEREACSSSGEGVEVMEEL